MMQISLCLTSSGKKSVSGRLCENNSNGRRRTGEERTTRSHMLGPSRPKAAVRLHQSDGRPQALRRQLTSTG